MNEYCACTVVVVVGCGPHAHIKFFLTTTIQVAEEGRENSPRLTRSAKKRKQQQRLPPTQKNERRDSGMVLNFSPPDQEANRRREQQEMNRKERERYVL